MSIFARMPIQRKLLISFGLTIGIALLLAGVGMVVSSGLTVYGALRNDLLTFARVIADNSSGSLAFDDPQSAQDNLGALRARSRIVSACLYRADGSMLAAYSGLRRAVCRPPSSNNNSDSATFDEITVLQQVYLRDRRIGVLELRYDLGEVYQAMTRSALTAVIVSLLASAIAFQFSSRLRRSIVGPIARLASTARAISQTRDYGIRAEQSSTDEVGQLAMIFNEMVTNIQSREQELKTALSDQKDTLSRLEQLNRDLEHSNADLARSNDDLERFAFVASHDLREPLRMITVYAQLLQDESLLQECAEAELYVSQVHRGTRRMQELLDDLRTYAEIGAFDQPESAVDLNVALVHAQENLGLSITSSSATITSSKLPVIRAYEGHFVSLFQNLISNAVKYRRVDSPLVNITCERFGEELRVAVSDNGIGIAEKFHSQIFVPFERLHGAEISGSGIGLAICKRVAERYGGKIWVQSVPEQGATFVFTVPADRQV